MNGYGVGGNSSSRNRMRQEDQRAINLILSRASNSSNSQINPIPPNSNTHHTFFDAMGSVWRIADKYHLTKDLPFTNFLMFGPQSAGKTTITERILGFPVGRVKDGIGTTRPMVLTTRRSTDGDGTKETFRVKGDGDSDYVDIDKRDIMNWVRDQMLHTASRSSSSKVTHERVYIEVSGPQYMNRRFVDLPGFQSNDERGGRGTRKAILELLKSELDNPDTVVVCVENMRQDYANSNLILAFREVLGDDFPKYRHRLVLALNKSDAWLPSGGVTQSIFLDHIASYTQGTGLVPIIIGSSIDPNNVSLRRARAEDNANFEDVEMEYATADSREMELYSSFFRDQIQLPPALESILKSKYRGFSTLLGTVDAMVVRRDKKNAQRIASQLLRILDETQDQIADLQRRLQLTAEGGGDVMITESQLLVKKLLDFLAQISTTDFGTAAAIVASDQTAIRRHGNDAYMEEMEFVFGDRTARDIPTKKIFQVRGGYYSRNRSYGGDGSNGAGSISGSTSSSSIATDLPADTAHAWEGQMYDTIRRLQQTKRGRLVEKISYLNMKLVQGALYERAIAVWSSSVYRFISPNTHDLLSMANAVGTDPEMYDPHRHDFKKAKRMAEIYIHRLEPAVQYLCQKIEFLLLKIFDTSWRGILRSPKTRAFVHAIGRDGFYTEVKRRFQKAIRICSAETYDHCFRDLHNEVQKLLPYSGERASVTGLMYAYPEVSNSMEEATKNFQTRIHKHFVEEADKIFPKDFKQDLPESISAGIDEGIKVLSVSGSVDPLLFAALQAVKKSLLADTDRSNGGGGSTTKSDGGSSSKGRKKKSFIMSSTNSTNNTNSNSSSSTPTTNLGSESLSEDRDERLLGFSACLYAHFLPRFITTIDGRVRSDLWAKVKDTHLVQTLEKSVVDFRVIQEAKERVVEYEEKIKELKGKANELMDAHSKLVSIVAKLPDYGDDEEDDDEEDVDVGVGGNSDDNSDDENEMMDGENDEDDYEDEDDYGGNDEDYHNSYNNEPKKKKMIGKKNINNNYNDDEDEDNEQQVKQTKKSQSRGKSSSSSSSSSIRTASVIAEPKQQQLLKKNNDITTITEEKEDNPNDDDTIMTVESTGLGDGWEERRHPGTGKTYYVNLITKQSQWHRPT